jgi:uncharacterized protein (DUF305 family)
MRKWRDEWYGDSPQAVNPDLPGMREGVQDLNLEKLDSLKEDPFDLEFIRESIPLHQGAVMMASDILSRDVHAELKTLAQGIIQKKQADIEQIQGWQQQWSK